MINTLVSSTYLDGRDRFCISNLRLPLDRWSILIGILSKLAMISSPCKIYIIAINGILVFCWYVIKDSQTPIFGWYYSSKTYIHAIWIIVFNKLLRKTQISLCIRPVWSESLLCAQWVAKGSVLLQADSEDSDQTGRMRRLIWVFAGRTVKDS